MGSELWAWATANAFGKLRLKACSEVAKPEWWNDEALKALSAKVVRAAPNEVVANNMRALVLAGQCGALEAGPRSAAAFKEAAVYWERAAALCSAPVAKASLVHNAGCCRSQAATM